MIYFLIILGISALTMLVMSFFNYKESMKEKNNIHTKEKNKSETKGLYKQSIRLKATALIMFTLSILLFVLLFFLLITAH